MSDNKNDKNDAAEKNADKNEKNQDGSDKPGIAGVMRDFALSGLATYFMTEDAVKGYIKDLKLPKELAGIVFDGIKNKKEDFYGLLVKEFGRVLSKVDITQEVSKFLERHKISIEAKVSFEPKPETETEKAEKKETTWRS